MRRGTLTTLGALGCLLAAPAGLAADSERMTDTAVPPAERVDTRTKSPADFDVAPSTPGDQIEREAAALAREDPHALIPEDPNASLVMTSQGLRIETRSSALVATPAGADARASGSALPAPAGTAEAVVPVAIDDPHSLIPSDPNASLVMSDDGLRVQTPAMRIATVAPAATPLVTGTPVDPGAEQRAGFGIGPGGPPTTRSPDELRSMRRERRGGDFLNSLTIAPRGFLNVDDDFDLDDRAQRGGSFAVQYDRVLARPLSFVLGFDFMPEDRRGTFRNSDATFGTDLGLNLFLIGGNNEGLYIGPRGYLGVSGLDDRNDSASGRLGFGGELGLRFIGSSGFTGGLAVGLQNRRLGVVDVDTGGRDDVDATEFERQNLAYGAVHFGWSW